MTSVLVSAQGTGTNITNETPKEQKDTPKVPSLRPKISLGAASLSQQPNSQVLATKDVRLGDANLTTNGPTSSNVPDSQGLSTSTVTGNGVGTNLRVPVSPSLKQTKPIAPPRPPILLKPKGKEVRICLPSITEIYTSIYNEIHKRVIETLGDVLDKVGEDYKINPEELKEKYLKELKVVLEKNQEEAKKIGIPTVKKPRTILASDVRCMARTANGAQCTRRKQKDEAGNEYDFCGSHRTNQPNGKISDPPLVIAEKKKRGRPPKKTVLVDGTVVESPNSEENDADGNEEVDSPYDDTTSMDFFGIEDGEQEYICNRNTKIVYEIPPDNQISDISDLTRVGIWDQEQGIITYDNKI